MTVYVYMYMHIHIDLYLACIKNIHKLQNFNYFE